MTIGDPVIVMKLLIVLCLSDNPIEIPLNRNPTKAEKSCMCTFAKCFQTKDHTKCIKEHTDFVNEVYPGTYPDKPWRSTLAYPKEMLNENKQKLEP